MQNWYECLEMKKKDEKEKMEDYQHKVAQMIESAEGSAVSCTKSPSQHHGCEFVRPL